MNLDMVPSAAVLLGMKEETLSDALSAFSDEKLYTVKEVQEKLGLSKPTLYRFFQEGKLEKIKIGKSTRIPASSLNKLLRK